MIDYPDLPPGWEYHDYGHELRRTDGVSLVACENTDLCPRQVNDFEARERLLPLMRSKLLPELPDGWSYSEYEDALLRPGPGGVTKLAAPRNKLSWRPLIEDFEFKEGARWTSEQIAAMQSKLTIAARIPDAGVCFAACACVRCVALTATAPDTCQVAPDGRHIWTQTGPNQNPSCQHCGVSAYGSGRVRGVFMPARQIGKSLIADAWKNYIFMAQDGLKKISADGGVIALSALSDPISWDSEREPVSAARYTIAPERIVELQKNDPSLTPERLTAGVAAMLDYGGDDDAGEVAAVWRAMSVSAAVSLLSEAEQRIAWLEAECKRLADGPPTQHPPEFVAKVLMDREGRDDPVAHARLTEVIRCARLDGRKQARDELAAAEDRIAALTKERDEACAVRDHVGQMCHELAGQAAALEADKATQRQDIYTRARLLLAAHEEIATLRARLALPDAPSDIDYHGPVKDGRAIPDPTHERFHGAVGDVIAGRILPAARRQMQEALKQAPRDDPTTASTSRPMPGKALGVAGQAIGLRLL